MPEPYQKWHPQQDDDLFSSVYENFLETFSREPRIVSLEEAVHVVVVV